jgi:sugar phosphate isomerase/epimerase
MRLSISNIAWNPKNDLAIAALLYRMQVNAIDIAHSKYFKQPEQVTSADIINLKQSWLQRDIDIVGMQALLFGTKGLNVFGNSGSRQRMLDHLNVICRIASELGARRLVFGSPKNRDCEGLSPIETREISTNFFMQLGDIAKAKDVIICLEPNPEAYGANFLTTTTETKEFVRKLAHPNIKMQLDTGALIMNNEDPASTIADCRGYIGHIHISEAQLAPVIHKTTYHKAIASALQRHLPDSIITIEMRATDTEIVSVKKSIETVQSIYC